MTNIYNQQIQLVIQNILNIDFDLKKVLDDQQCQVVSQNTTNDKKQFCNLYNKQYQSDQKQSFKDLSFGLFHQCGITTNNEIICDGSNHSNQLEHPKFRLVSDNSQIISGVMHSCAYPFANKLNQFLGLEFKIHCWGDNSKGQTDLPHDLESIEDQSLVSAGSFLSCVITSKDNTIRCWGADEFSLNQNIEKVIRNKNQNVTGLKVDFGEDNTVCMITSRIDTEESDLMMSLVDCFGTCRESMCSVPDVFNGGNTQISTGQDHVCTIIGHEDRLGCWGSTKEGQTQVPSLFEKGAKRVVAIRFYTCAIKHNAQLLCFGAIPQYQTINLPKKYIQDLSVGGLHTCNKINGSIQCFGDNNLGQIDVPISLKDNSLSIQASWDFNCAINVDKQLSCWGSNMYGQYDFQSQFNTEENNVMEMSLGLMHMCILRSQKITSNQPNTTNQPHSYNLHYTTENESTICCWGGHNEHGETDIPANWVYGVQKLALGDDFTCAYRNSDLDYTLFCFGNNEQSAIDVPLSIFLLHIEFLVAGDAHVCVDCVKYPESKKQRKHMIVCWGSDSYGQTSAPIKPLRSSNIEVTALSAGAGHNCAIFGQKGDILDFNVVCWGMININTGYNVLSKNPRLISTNFNHTCFIDEKGDERCLGDNEQGQCDSYV